MKVRDAGDAGFSLVELVTIIVVLGILAAYALPRFVDRTGFESRGVYDQAQGLVRYAQKIAIAQRQSLPAKQPIFVVITANRIRICYDAACITAVTDPSTGVALALGPVPTGVSLAPVTTFSYAGSGAPSIAAQLAINVNSSGVGDINRTFFVEAVTGYVHP
jgi:MSHA pilin protein MshC